MTTSDQDFDDRLQQAKLAAMKELAYGASHEINNPLANIVARAQTLLRDETEPERCRMLSAIHQQALRAHEMISDLMLFARPPALVCEPFNLSALLEQLADELAESCEEQSIVLTFSGGEAPLEIDADRGQFAVAIKAVLVNAIEAVGQKGEVRLTVSQALCPERGSLVRIEVSDNGGGLSAKAKEHLFDPFFSGREAGRGLGFGLSKCWRIVTDHGGTVVADSSAEGVTLSLQLPVSQQERGTAATRKAS